MQNQSIFKETGSIMNYPRNVRSNVSEVPVEHDRQSFQRSSTKLTYEASRVWEEFFKKGLGCMLLSLRQVKKPLKGTGVLFLRATRGKGQTDEAHFWLNGYVNKQNCRIWSEANPQVYVETPLHPEKLTVWCALWAGGILLQKR
ncbi:hypothetical protein TNCV_2889751 [Trichonephila clavipes]|nr:hypothetical protein TNCV_2889751 [Trichonephila clavipes]